MKLPRYLRGTPAHPPLVPSPDPVCAATTKAGKPCRLPRKPGSDKCAVHASKP